MLQLRPRCRPDQLPSKKSLLTANICFSCLGPLLTRLRALREPEETFSDVILRLTDRGSYEALSRSTADSGPNV